MEEGETEQEVNAAVTSWWNKYFMIDFRKQTYKTTRRETKFSL